MYFQARSFFQAAYVIAPHMYEPHYNWAALADQVGITKSYSFAMGWEGEGGSENSVVAFNITVTL